MSCRILTVGHIQSLKYLSEKGNIIVGLISDKGMKGYKDPIVSYSDRKYILENLSIPLKVLKQNSLDPSYNIEQWRPDLIASGDGWEKVELNAIKKYKLKVINIKLPKKYSVTSIIKKCQSIV